MKSYLLLLSFVFTVFVNAQTKYIWTGGDGDWSNSAKWNPAGVPGVLDTAVIIVDGNYRVTVDLNNVTVASVRLGYPESGSTFTQELYMEGKTFTVNDSVKINVRGKLMLWDNSTLGGTGKITNNGTLLIKQSIVNNDLINNSSGYFDGYSQSALNGNIVNEGFLGTYGTYGYGSAFLTIANGFSNEGTIRLGGDNTGSIVSDATLIVTNGTLINNNQLISYGTEMYGGNNYLKAELINNDSLIISSRPFELNKPGAHHVNNGFIHMVNSAINQREFNVLQSGSNPYFNNNGIIHTENNCKMVFKSGILNFNTDDLIVEGVFVVKDTCIVNLNVNYTIQNTSTIELRNSATVSGTGVITNEGSLVLYKGDINTDLVNTINGSIQAFSQSSINGSVVNQGFLGAYGTYGFGSAFLTIANGFTNEGTLRLWGDNTGSIVGNATIIVTNGSLVNNKKLLSGGTEDYGGTNSLKAELINNDSTIIPSRYFILDKADANHINNGFIHFKRSNWNNREFVLTQSGTNPSFENFGTFKIDSTYVLRLTQGSFINQPSGIVTGIGSINSQNGNLNNNGNFLPGDNIGTFSVAGNYPEESTSVLKIDIGGYSSGECDRLNVSGNATLNGMLNVRLVNGFTPAVGDSFLVLTYGSRTGVFSSVVDSSIASGAVWDTIYTSSSLYIKLIDEPTKVENNESDKLPTEYALNQNYPNPFNPSTKISWQSPIGGHTTLKIYDLLGNKIATLVDEFKPVGKYEIDFDASHLTSGVYFYQLNAGSFVETKKLTLLK